MEVIGLDKLARSFNNIASKEVIAQGIQKTCLRIERDAKMNCPVDKGLLRESITHRVDVDTLTGVVGTSVEYAPYVEYGTGIYAEGGVGRQDRWSYQTPDGKWHSTVGQRPQPFLYPALLQNETHVVPDILEAIRKAGN